MFLGPPSSLLMFRVTGTAQQRREGQQLAGKLGTLDAHKRPQVV